MWRRGKKSKHEGYFGVCERDVGGGGGGGGGSVKGRHTIVVGSSAVVCWWGGQTDLSAPSENGTVPCVQFRIQKII